ncbi:MAG: nicotinamide-nucleotide amidohydrolase family protein [Lachnospiraceae bacterium]|nr:nicotinamide-nucleotide amidohydrolase family protein [Lachnospiraceae bacterium]
MDAGEIVDTLIKKGLTVSCAESCTGGLLASAFVDIPGSSACFKEGYVTYSNEVKERVLGVPAAVIDTYGVVSGECAAEMAKCLRSITGSDFALSTTGIAGPDGGTDLTPVGTVFIGCSYCLRVIRAGCACEFKEIPQASPPYDSSGISTNSSRTVVQKFIFSGERNDVRAQAVAAALALLEKELKNA